MNSLETPEEIARQIYIESPMAHPSVVRRRDWVEKVGGYQEHDWPEDYDLWLRLDLADARFAKVPEVLLWRREHPRRLTRTDSRHLVENFTERWNLPDLLAEAFTGPKDPYPFAIAMASRERILPS